MLQRFVLLAAFSAMACGCTMEVVPDSEPASGDDAKIKSVEQAVGVFPDEFYWVQGNSSVGLGPASDRFCFLTQVRGQFEGSAERVRVYISGGSWWLGGTSNQHDVSATARCVPLNFLNRTSTYTVEKVWSSDSVHPTLLAADNGQTACFLTRVNGALQSVNDRLTIYSQAGNWYLNGDDQSGFIEGAARCVDATPIYNSGRIYTDDCSGLFPNPHTVFLYQYANIACGLTEVGGHLGGGGERVRITQSGGGWYLTVKTEKDCGSTPTSIFGAAVCIF